MEKTKKKHSQTFSQFRTTHPESDIMLKKSSNIITNCDRTVSSNINFCTSYLSTNANININTNTASTAKGVYLKKASKPPSLLLGKNQPNLQQKQMTEKYVQKLKSNSKQLQKQPTIRKSDIGQNQLVFTNQQQLRLEIIDQFIQRGFQLPEDPFNIQLYPKANVTDAYKQKSEIQASLRQSNHPNPFSQQLAQFAYWGQYGNKQNVTDLLDEYGRQFLQTINFKQLEHPKHKFHKKFKQQKVVNFIKNSKAVLNQQAKFKQKQRERSKQRRFKIKSRASIDMNINLFNTGNSGRTNRYKQTDTQIYSNINIDAQRQKLKINPNLLSQFETQKYVKMIKQKLFRSVNVQKCNQPSGFAKINRKQLSKFQFIQKLRQLQSTISQKYANVRNTPYMTQARKQALYICEMIKQAKKIMNKKDYTNLRFAIGVQNNQKQIQIQKQRESELQRTKQRQKRAEQNYFDNQLYLKRNNSKEKDINKGNQQIEKILCKNKDRLKVQRQRVIEKLRF